MFKETLKSIEDPKYPLLGPSLWLLRATGILLSSNKLVCFLYMTNQVIVQLFIFSQWIEACFLGGDLDSLVVHLKLTAISFVNITKANTFVIWQRKWKDILRYVTDADMEERRHTDEYRKRIVNNYTVYSRTMTFVYCLLAFITLMTVVVNPLVKYIRTPDFMEGIRDGTVPFPRILNGWVPFDKDASPACWLITCWHVQLMFYGGSIVAAYDSSALVIMKFIENKFFLLQHRCSLIYKSDEGVITDEQFHSRVKECHQVHTDLVKYAESFNSLLSPVMFLYTLTCSIFLCASAFELTKTTSSFLEKALSAEFAMFGTLQLLVYCMSSNNVYYKSAEVSFGVYESDWYKLDGRRQRTLVLLAGQLRKSLLFTSGPFMDLTLATFISIVKGAYSFYTLFT